MCGKICEKNSILQAIFDYCGVCFDIRPVGNRETTDHYEVGLKSNGRIHRNVGFSSKEDCSKIKCETTLDVILPSGKNLDEFLCDTVLDLMSFRQITGIYEFDKDSFSVSTLFKTPPFKCLKELRIHLDLLSIPIKHD